MRDSHSLYKTFREIFLTIFPGASAMFAQKIFSKSSPKVCGHSFAPQAQMNARKIWANDFGKIYYIVQCGRTASKSFGQIYYTEKRPGTASRHRGYGD
jgi:hypothetical protein